MSSGARWERFARTAPEAHIAARDVESRSEAALAAFYESGRRDADAIVEIVGPLLPSFTRAVDVGAGVGRVAFAMAGRFESVLAVDAAPTMLALLEARARAHGIGNVACAHADAEWAPPAADLVYSVYTLQHLSGPEIASSVERAARALPPGGIAYLELDTRPATPPYRLRNVLPDAVLPAAWRRGMRTIRREPGPLRSLFRRSGLDVVDERGARTRRHAFILRRA